MENKNIIAVYLGAFTALLSLCLLLWCSFYGGVKVGEKRASVITDTVTVRDSFPVYVPYPQLIIADTVFAEIDTAAVIADYYSRKIYADTLSRSGVTVVIHDTVYNNSLANRYVEFDVSVPVGVNKKMNAINISFDGNPYSLNLIAGYTRNRIEYRLGYDLYNRTPTVGIGIKLASW